MARPSDYSPEIAAQICRRIADGQSLRQIDADEAMPGKTTIMRWLGERDKSEFRDQYAQAREAQADKLVDEILEIADDSSLDKKTVETDHGEVEVVDHENIQRSRLRVDARKWAASKLAPKKYGDRVVTEHQGAIGHYEADKPTPEKVRGELADIFGAEHVPDQPADEPQGNDRVLQSHPDESFGPIAGAFTPGEAEAGAERPVLPADGDMQAPRPE